MQLGDYILLALALSTIAMQNIPLFLFYISAFHFFIGIFYIMLIKQNKIPMAPSILISWMLLY